VDLYLYPRDAGRGGHDVQLRITRGYEDTFLQLRPPEAGWGVHDVLLYAASRLVVTTAGPPPGFPTQYAGLRYFSGTVKELCLVALADGSGGLRIVKNGTTYSAYLVDVTDPNASGVRVQTPSGVKAIRLKT
jgi:hypothetical protein